MMRNYRLVLLLKSDLKKEEKEKLLDEVKKWRGTIKDDKVSSLGERKLAYSIKREKKGDYVVMEFSAETIAQDLEKRIQIQDNILRHLLVRTK